MKILMIIPALPLPPRSAYGGEQIRFYNIVKQVSARHEVSLICLMGSAQEEKLVPEIARYCVSVETVLLKKRPKWKHIWLIPQHLILGRPLYLRYFVVEEMRRKIKKLFGRKDFDIVQIEHLCMAPYINAVPKKSHCKKILTFDNIDSVLFYRMFKIERRIPRKAALFLNCLLFRRSEARITERFDKCVTVSDLDKEILGSRNPRLDIYVIPNAIDINYHRLLSINAESKDILMVGMLSYLPNLDGLLYFYNRIFPLIKEKIEDVTLTIVGKDPSPRILGMASDKSVKVVGRVDDITSYYEKCAILAVPLRAGSGTRGKILESMALGRPVVSTSIGCEGLDVADGENILIADKPEDFAECAIRLLNDPQLWKRIAVNGRRLVEEHYNWDHIGRDLTDLYEKAAAGEKPS